LDSKAVCDLLVFLHRNLNFLSKVLTSSISVERALDLFSAGNVLCNAGLRQYSRWRTGGVADYLVRPATAQQVADVIAYLHESGIPWVAIGHTSNVLISDAKICGVVLQVTDKLSQILIEDQNVRAQAGVWVPRFAKTVAGKGLAGAEHIIGIPGTIGGLICMNGGSMRRGIGENVVSVRCVDTSGNELLLSQQECCFGYRKSKIQESGLIVTEATFKFSPGDRSILRKQMLEILRSRRKKFPLKLPNCGSVFVSDPAMYQTHGPPGAVIDRCALKGFRIGDAQVSTKHSNFVVNLGNATSDDIISVVKHVRDTCWRLEGVKLQTEVKYLTSECQLVPLHDVLL